MEVLLLLREGLSNGQIAERLDLSLRTVEYRLWESRKLLGLTGRGLVVWVAQNAEHLEVALGQY